MSHVNKLASESERVTDDAHSSGEAVPKGGLVRVTVNLTQRSFADLQKISELTGLGKTDVINRSLQIYSLVQDLLDRGNGSLVVKHPDGELERIYIL